MSEEKILLDERKIEEERKSKLRTIPVKKIKFSVKFKITLLTALLVVVMTIAISFYLLINYVKIPQINEMKHNSKLTMQNLSQGLTEIFEDGISRHDIVMKTKGTMTNIEKISIANLQEELIDVTDKDIYDQILKSKFDDSTEKKYLKIEENIINFLNDNPYFEKTYKEGGYEKISFIAPVKDFNDTAIGYIKIDFTLKYIMERINKIQMEILILVIIFLFIGIILSYIVSSQIIRPIKKLSQGVQIIGDGNLKYKIEIHTKDELEQLADEFNNMTEKILAAQGNLAEKERMDEQLEIAKKIQENLLVEKFPELPEMEFSAFYKPATEIGGDYYDVIYQSNTRRIGYIIADVAGKGVPAALIMVMIRTILHSTFNFIKKANEAITNINKGIARRLTGDKFATMFYFIYDIDTGRIEYSNGAHSPLIVYKKKLNQILEFDTEGAPVGIDYNAVFGVNTAYLDEGDIIVNYTDGIYEAMSEKDELFQASRVKELIKNNSQLSAEQIKTIIINKINEFVGKAPQHDDMALTIMKIKKINKKPIINPNINKTTSEVINPFRPRPIL